MLKKCIYIYKGKEYTLENILEELNHVDNIADNLGGKISSVEALVEAEKLLPKRYIDILYDFFGIKSISNYNISDIVKIVSKAEMLAIRGLDILGTYKDGVIYLQADSEGNVFKGVLKHEIVHKVLRDYYTEEQRNKILSKVRAEYQLSFDDNTVEEFIAESFRLGTGEGFINKLKHKLGLISFVNTSDSLTRFINKLDAGIRGKTVNKIAQADMMKVSDYYQLDIFTRLKSELFNEIAKNVSNKYFPRTHVESIQAAINKLANKYNSYLDTTRELTDEELLAINNPTIQEKYLIIRNFSVFQKLDNEAIFRALESEEANNKLLTYKIDVLKAINAPAGDPAYDADFKLFVASDIFFNDKKAFDFLSFYFNIDPKTYKIFLKDSIDAAKEKLTISDELDIDEKINPKTKVTQETKRFLSLISYKTATKGKVFVRFDTAFNIANMLFKGIDTSNAKTMADGLNANAKKLALKPDAQAVLAKITELITIAYDKRSIGNLNMRIYKRLGDRGITIAVSKDPIPTDEGLYKPEVMVHTQGTQSLKSFLDSIASQHPDANLDMYSLYEIYEANQQLAGLVTSLNSLRKDVPLKGVRVWSMGRLRLKYNPIRLLRGMTVVTSLFEAGLVSIVLTDTPSKNILTSIHKYINMDTSNMTPESQYEKYKSIAGVIGYEPRDFDDFTHPTSVVDLFINWVSSVDLMAFEEFQSYVDAGEVNKYKINKYVENILAAYKVKNEQGQQDEKALYKSVQTVLNDKDGLVQFIYDIDKNQSPTNLPTSYITGEDSLAYMYVNRTYHYDNFLNNKTKHRQTTWAKHNPLSELSLEVTSHDSQGYSKLGFFKSYTRETTGETIARHLQFGFISQLYKDRGSYKQFIFSPAERTKIGSVDVPVIKGFSEVKSNIVKMLEQEADRHLLPKDKNLSSNYNRSSIVGRENRPAFTKEHIAKLESETGLTKDQLIEQEADWVVEHMKQRAEEFAKMFDNDDVFKKNRVQNWSSNIIDAEHDMHQSNDDGIVKELTTAYYGEGYIGPKIDAVRKAGEDKGLAAKDINKEIGRLYAKEYAKIFYHNYAVNSYWVNQLMASDFSYYKHKEDLIKRIKIMTANGLTVLADGLHGRLPVYSKVIVANDPTFTIKDNNILHPEYQAGKPLELTDGFAWITEEYYQQLANSVSNGYMLDEAIKPVLFQQDDKGQPLALKFAVGVLTKANIAARPKLAEIATYLRTHQASMLTYTSSVKVGIPTKPVNTINGVPTEAPTEQSIVTIDNRELRLQLNPSKDLAGKGTNPSQLTYQLNALGRNKEEADKVFKSNQSIVTNGLTLLKNTLGYQKGKAINPTTLLRKLSSSLDSIPGMEAIVDILSTTKTVKTKAGKFIQIPTITVDLPLIKDKVLSALISSFNNTIYDYPFTTSKLVLQPEMALGGMTLTTIEKTETGIQRGKKTLSDDFKLQYRIMEGDNIGETEVILPDTLAYLYESGDIIDIPRIIGYRIPSTGIHSMISCKIVGFYPTNGSKSNIIIAPREIMALMGSDYDVDTLFTSQSALATQTTTLWDMLPETLGDDTLKDLLSKLTLTKGKIISFDTDVVKTLEAHLPLFNIKQANLAVIVEYLNIHHTNNILEQFHTVLTKTTEGKLTNLPELVIPISPQDINNITKQNEFTNESVFQMLARLNKIERKDYPDDSSYEKAVTELLYPKSNLSDFITTLEMHKNIRTGATLTGIFANLYKVLAYSMQALPTKELPFKDPNISWEGEDITKFSITEINNKAKRVVSIFERLDTFTNLAIDNVKELVLHIVGLTPTNTNSFGVLLSFGIPLNDVVLLFKILDKYNEGYNLKMTPAFEALVESRRKKEDQEIEDIVKSMRKNFPTKLSKKFLEDYYQGLITDENAKDYGYDSLEHIEFTLQVFNVQVKSIGAVFRSFVSATSSLRGVYEYEKLLKMLKSAKEVFWAYEEDNFRKHTPHIVSAIDAAKDLAEMISNTIFTKSRDFKNIMDKFEKSYKYKDYINIWEAISSAIEKFMYSASNIYIGKVMINPDYNLVTPVKLGDTTYTGKEAWNQHFLAKLEKIMSKSTNRAKYNLFNQFTINTNSESGTRYISFLATSETNGETKSLFQNQFRELVNMDIGGALNDLLPHNLPNDLGYNKLQLAMFLYATNVDMTLRPNSFSLVLDGNLMAAYSNSIRHSINEFKTNFINLAISGKLQELEMYVAAHVLGSDEITHDKYVVEDGLLYEKKENTLIPLISVDVMKDVRNTHMSWIHPDEYLTTPSYEQHKGVTTRIIKNQYQLKRFNIAKQNVISQYATYEEFSQSVNTNKVFLTSDHELKDEEGVLYYDSEDTIPMDVLKQLKESYSIIYIDNVKTINIDNPKTYEVGGATYFDINNYCS